MTQLELFEKKIYPHSPEADVMLAESIERIYNRAKKKNYDLENEEIKINNNHKEISALEEAIIENYADYVHYFEKTRTIIKKGELCLNAGAEAQRYFLKNNFEKFKETGSQPVGNYSDKEVFGLYMGVMKSYNKKLVTLKKEFNDFYSKNNNVLKQYNL